MRYHSAAKNFIKWWIQAHAMIGWSYNFLQTEVAKVTHGHTDGC